MPGLKSRHILKPSFQHLKPSFQHLPRPAATPGLFEGTDGGSFVVPDIEDGVELGDLEEVVDLLGEVEQLEFAAGVPDRGKSTDQFADAGAIDVVNVSEVQQNFFRSLSEHIVDGVAQRDTAFPQGDASTKVEDGDSVHLAGCDFHAHAYVSFSLKQAVGPALDV